MTVIHDFKRVGAATHNFGGVDYDFKPNEKGDVTCDIGDDDAIDRFLSIEGFCPYVTEQAAEIAKPPGSTGKKPPKAAEKPALSPYLLKNGSAEFDLRPLNDGQLREFAAANTIAIPDAATGDAIRDAIVEALKG